jgi:hypothetical protein
MGLLSRIGGLLTSPQILAIHPFAEPTASASRSPWLTLASDHGKHGHLAAMIIRPSQRFQTATRR